MDQIALCKLSQMKSWVIGKRENWQLRLWPSSGAKNPALEIRWQVEIGGRISKDFQCNFFSLDVQVSADLLSVTFSVEVSGLARATWAELRFLSAFAMASPCTPSPCVTANYSISIEYIVAFIIIIDFSLNFDLFIS